MKLVFRGHDDRYAVEQSLLAFFPEERPVYQEPEPGEDNWARVDLHQGPVYATATTEIAHGGRLGRGPSRALLRDAPVLLLDEATSALDVTTERTILRNLAARYPHKTCIVTTHRPTVISLCRRVYQVSGGRMELLDNDRAQRLAMDF